MMSYIKYILIIVLGIIFTILGVKLICIKLFKKDSWLYKESEGVDWLYDLSGIRTWGLILNLILMGLGMILYSLDKLNII